MSEVNPFRGDFVRLAQEFRSAVREPGEWLFCLRWSRIWRTPEESEFPRAGTFICDLGSDRLGPRPAGPRNQLRSWVVDLLEGTPAAPARFLELAADAGSALPPKIGGVLISRYLGPFSDSPVARWCSLLFAIREASLNSPAPDLFDDFYLSIDRPFSASIDAIATCGLLNEYAHLPWHRDTTEVTEPVPGAVTAGSASPNAPAKSEPRAASYESPTGAVRLFGRGEQAEVDGVLLPALSELEYEIVRALLEAGASGLSGPNLNRHSGRGGARNALYELAKKPGWNDVIALAGRRGCVHRIR